MATQQFPDFQLPVREASSFILDSHLARRALRCREEGISLFLRDLVSEIDSLAQSCHLPEFTDHGLPHLCSLIDRASEWTVGDGTPLVDQLTFDESATLLIALLVHDLGMLSQNPDDEPPPSTVSFFDVATWVRRSHIARLRCLMSRVFDGSEHSQTVRGDLVQNAITVAELHGRWGWQFPDSLDPRTRGLAAIVAVVDLLDEDARRCDSRTLLSHRKGTVENKAHWIRHSLTSSRVMIKRNRVGVTIVSPAGTTSLIAPVFDALRNQYLLINAYKHELRPFGFQRLDIIFNMPAGLPDTSGEQLPLVGQIDEFATESALVYHLLNTFFPEALLDRSRIAPESLTHLENLDLASVDLALFEQVRSSMDFRSTQERSFRAILSR